MLHATPTSKNRWLEKPQSTCWRIYIKILYNVNSILPFRYHPKILSPDWCATRQGAGVDIETFAALPISRVNKISTPYPGVLPKWGGVLRKYPPTSKLSQLRLRVSKLNQKVSELTKKLSELTPKLRQLTPRVSEPR
jgi:hypothetical protein